MTEDDRPVLAVIMAAWAKALGRTAGLDGATFLSAGGHSLAAARMIAELQAELGVALPLAALLRDDPTVHELAGLVARQAASQQAPVGPPARPCQSPRPQAQSGPAGPALTRLWVWHRLHPRSGAYNVVRVVEVEGQLMPPPLRAALADLAERHESLRCAFTEPTVARPEVVVGQPAIMPLSVRVVRAPAPARLGDLVDTALHDLAARPLPMDRPPLWRAGLVYAPEPNRSWLIVVLHHLISDLRATDVLLAELAIAYGARLAGLRPEFGQPAPSLLEHLAHEAAQVSSPRWREDLAWWAGHLAGCEPAPALPLFAKAAMPQYRGQASTTDLTAQESAEVARTLQAARLTPATFFLAASVAVLSAWGAAGQAEIVGVPSARRARQADARLIGFMLDTLMLRVTAPDDLPFASLCRQILTGYLEAAEHGLPPYDEVLRAANLPRLAEGNPLIRLWFNDLTQASCPAVLGGATATEYDLPPAAALFDLNIYLRMTTDGRYRLHLMTPAGAMEPADAAALIGQVRAASVRAAADVSAPLRDVVTVVAVGGAVPAAVTGPAPDTHRAPARTDALLRHWARADRATALAVAGPGLALDYAGLDAEVDRVASSLAGIAGARVAIPARRDGVFVTRLIACWRAGVVPVIIDASWPRWRRDAALVVSQARWAFADGQELSPQPTGIEASHRHSAGHAAGTEPSLRVGHVLFTSGSTGTPLAVAVPPGALEHELDVLRDRFAIGPGDRVSFLSGPAHDVALRDVVLPLRAGATVCLPPPEVSLDAAEVAGWLDSAGVTVVNATPLLLGLAFGLSDRRLDSLRLVVSGGAPLSSATAELIRSRAPGATLVNGYGCTETPQLAAAAIFPPGASLPASGVPVGASLSDRRAELRASPRDVTEPAAGRPGEVWVAGPRIAAGYLGAELPGRFTVDDAGVRWFRTGDIGRKDAAGRLHVAGRKDRQVLVNGHRLALDEVEMLARTLPGVADAVAAPVAVTASLVAGDGAHAATSLRLWVLQTPGARLDGAQVRRALGQMLPDAAVPPRVLVVDRLPTTANLKATVPADTVPADTVPADTAAVPPGTALDARLRQIAEEIAGGPFDPEATFFRVGFTSLSLLQLSAELAQAIARPVPPITPFRYPTLRALSEWVARSDGQLAGQALASPAPGAAERHHGPGEPAPGSVRPAGDGSPGLASARPARSSVQAMRAARQAARATLGQVAGADERRSAP